MVKRGQTTGLCVSLIALYMVALMKLRVGNPCFNNDLTNGRAHSITTLSKEICPDFILISTHMAVLYPGHDWGFGKM